MKTKHFLRWLFPLVLLIGMLSSVTAFASDLAAYTRISTVGDSSSTFSRVVSSTVPGVVTEAATVDPGSRVWIQFIPADDYIDEYTTLDHFWMEIFDTDNVSGNRSSIKASQYGKRNDQNYGNPSFYYYIDIPEDTYNACIYVSAFAGTKANYNYELICRFKININTIVNSIEVEPSNITLKLGEQYKFTAKVDGGGSQHGNVYWETLGEQSTGTRFGDGGYLTIGADETATSIQVRAKSAFDTSIVSPWTTVYIQTITAVLSVKIKGDHFIKMAPGSTKDFAADVEVAGGASQRIKWSITGQTSASTQINSRTGLLQIGEDETAEKISVVAQSTGTANDTATVHVGHAWEVTSSTPSTCKTLGANTYTCTICEEVKTEGAPYAEHKYGPATVTKPATQSEEGEQTATCTVCGATVKTPIAKLPTSNTDKTKPVVMKPVIHLEATMVPLQIKKSVNLASLVTGLIEGDQIVTWTSDNPAIATVAAGKVKAKKKAGTANITVTTKLGASAVITVKTQKKAVKTKSISVNGKELSLTAGQTFALNAKANPISSSQKITYKTSNKKIATVSSKGVIKAKKAGKVKITVKSGSKKVTVTLDIK